MWQSNLALLLSRIIWSEDAEYASPILASRLYYVAAFNSLDAGWSGRQNLLYYVSDLLIIEDFIRSTAATPP
jgi:hypothetical protein